MELENILNEIIQAHEDKRHMLCLVSLYAYPSFQFVMCVLNLEWWRSGSGGGPVRRGRGAPVMGARER